MYKPIIITQKTHTNIFRKRVTVRVHFFTEQFWGFYLQQEKYEKPTL